MNIQKTTIRRNLFSQVIDEISQTQLELLVFIYGLACIYLRFTVNKHYKL